MKKKETKTVDIADLRSDDNYNKNDLETQTIVDVSAKVEINDISQHPKTKTPKIPSFKNKEIDQKAIPRRKFDPSIVKGPRFIKYKGNGSEKSIVSFMTDKHAFDQKEVNYTSVILFAISVLFYLMARYLGSAQSPDNIYIAAFAESANYAIATIYEPYRQLYVFILLILFYTIPIKKFTNLMVEVFYDGLTVPYEIFPTVQHRRKRVEWRYIYSIELATKKEIPFVRLLGDRKQQLGEMRLDVDDPKKLYEIIDTYAPAEHPIRILFNNSKKS
jgi:hypothetical protein